MPHISMILDDEDEDEPKDEFSKCDVLDWDLAKCQRFYDKALRDYNKRPNCYNSQGLECAEIVLKRKLDESTPHE